MIEHEIDKNVYSTSDKLSIVQKNALLMTNPAPLCFASQYFISSILFLVRLGLYNQVIFF